MGLAVVTPLVVVAVRRYAPPKPNILFVLIDTLRADRVGPRGPAGSLTPFLDRYGAHALVFERAYAPSSWTIPSVASLFVGQRPFEHGMLDFSRRLPAGAVTLAEVLRLHGVDTAAFTASGVMGVGDFDRGFDTYRVVGHPDITDKPDATVVNAAALHWLDHRDAARPFFLYLQYLEPHFPYRPHEGITRPRSPEVVTEDEVLTWRTNSGATVADPERRRDVWGFSPAEVERVNDLYDGEVAYLDRRLEVLFDALETRGALAHTIVVITSDHGEEFGEHDLFGHGVSLYETVIRVPLIVHLPGARPAARVSPPADTAGIAAALLRTLGIAPPPTFRVAAVPFDARDVPPARQAPPVVSELARIEHFAIWRHRSASVEGDRKLLVTGSGQLAVHDLREDPGEQRPQPPGPEDVARAAALDPLPPSAADGSAADGQGLSPGMAERLRALGYLDGPPQTDPTSRSP